ncbi:helix-turn-helix transcriptional regulator [Mycobacterium sp. PS03-16]|uniref:ATP-binding protein n=1 Tax=Mycobacterium sp. PS03-16 TaxID=2559611 RepID=UPI00107466B8|nr:LuxR family transcriptional regulator [Mycobacterium sp. PS03-16]TFV56116.1 helix-turn-helix transcriptional regulator [Mycobacterium sp. PS03-16]
MDLVGRRHECETLDALLHGLRAGSSQVLVVHGEAGVGKTALLRYAADRAADCDVVRVVGVEAEQDFAFAALHQLCGPVLDAVEALPRPQADALRIAFGISHGPPPDRFLIGLAVLGLLSEVAATRPLLCVVDDHQWLDRASAQILTFVARRLAAEPVGLLFATRTLGPDFTGLPQLEVTGLADTDSHRLLDAAVPGRLDDRVRDQIIAECRGNPLALLELPRALTPAQLAGGFGLPARFDSPGTAEETLRARVAELPYQTRRLLALAAAEPAGEPSAVWRGAELLGIRTSVVAPAVDAGLVELDQRITFRHPLIRSLAYRSASTHDRRAIHRALATVTDADLEPDRRAWHLGHAAAGPDESVAAELERCAARAQNRGGLAAAAAFLQRATALSVDQGRRADRAIAAASAMAHSGATGETAALLGVAEALPLDPAQQARADLVRAQLAFITHRGNDAAPLLLQAAARFEDIDVRMARGTYLEALAAALLAGRLAQGCDVLDVARAAVGAPPAPDPPLPIDLLLDGMARNHHVGFTDGLPLLRAALAGFGDAMPPEQELRWLWLACVTAAHVWDEHRLAAMSRRYVELAREMGALGELPMALNAHSYSLMVCGDFDAADALLAEFHTVLDATGTSSTPHTAIGLAGWRGDRPHAEVLIKEAIAGATRRGEGVGLNVAYWANALLHNGLGDYRTALDCSRLGIDDRGGCTSSTWAMIEQIEAAARLGELQTARDTLARLAAMTTPSGTDWSLGIEARCRALVSTDAAAEDHYRDAVDRLSRTGFRPDLARAHLVYGEWLRRRRRRTEARAQLRTAYTMCEEIGLQAFGERARRELLATGESARKRSSPADGRQLTAQEAQIARMARDGLSNPEISARLFISARTVQYHLSKVFAKLGIRSRSQLAHVLDDAR